MKSLLIPFFQVCYQIKMAVIWGALGHCPNPVNFNIKSRGGTKHFKSVLQFDIDLSIRTVVSFTLPVPERTEITKWSGFLNIFQYFDYNLFRTCCIEIFSLYRILYFYFIVYIFIGLFLFKTTDEFNQVCPRHHLDFPQNNRPVNFNITNLM